MLEFSAMDDVSPAVTRWYEAGRKVAWATVMTTWGSSPRQPGARLAVSDNGEHAGSVSGGCVEGAVIETALEVLRLDRPQKVHFGVTDEIAWSVGLACGGDLDVWIEPIDRSFYETFQQLERESAPLAILTVMSGQPLPVGSKFLYSNGIVAASSTAPVVTETVKAILERSAVQRIQVGLPAVLNLALEPGISLEVFIEPVLPDPKLIIIGAVHLAIHLAALAKILGYRTTLIDPRRSFATKERFPEVDELIVEWPDRAMRGLSIGVSTAIAVLTHDPKIDDPAILAALKSDAFYIGALGSQRTQKRRRERLLAAGVTSAEMERIRGPIGLDLGGRAPQEIALAIIAEITALRYHRDRTDR